MAYLGPFIIGAVFAIIGTVVVVRRKRIVAAYPRITFRGAPGSTANTSGRTAAIGLVFAIGGAVTLLSAGAHWL